MKYRFACTLLILVGGSVVGLSSYVAYAERGRAADVLFLWLEIGLAVAAVLGAIWALSTVLDHDRRKKDKTE